MPDDEDILGEVSAAELHRRIHEAQRRTIRTSTPGVINTYRRTGDQQNTADVELPIRPDGEAQAALSHVPVLILGGGDGALVFPYEEGDSGLVAFCETEIGTWRTSGDVGEPADGGRLTAAGPVLIPGLRPVGSTISADAGATALIGSDVRLGTATGTTKSALHKELLDDLSDLLSYLSTWVTAVDAIVGPLPSTAPLTGQITTMIGKAAGGLYHSPSVSVEE